VWLQKKEVKSDEIEMGEIGNDTCFGIGCSFFSGKQINILIFIHVIKLLDQIEDFDDIDYDARIKLKD
jgi:hypothetical protein